MADSKRRRTAGPTGSTFGNVAYSLDYYGDVAAAPAPRYAPPQPRTEPREVPKRAPQVKPRVHERSRVRVRVREQQAVAADGTLSYPTSEQSVYIDLSEPDNAVVYDNTEGTGGITGFFQAVGELIAAAVEYFR